MSKLFTNIKNRFHHYFASLKNEHFDTNQTLSWDEAIAAALALFILIGLMLVLGKYLWNDVLCHLVNGVNKVKSVWEILGLSVLIHLLV